MEETGCILWFIDLFLKDITRFMSTVLQHDFRKCKGWNMLCTIPTVEVCYCQPLYDVNHSRYGDENSHRLYCVTVWRFHIFCLDVYPLRFKDIHWISLQNFSSLLSLSHQIMRPPSSRKCISVVKL